jgi:glycopeptide antibiotics resistance protein
VEQVRGVTQRTLLERLHAPGIHGPSWGWLIGLIAAILYGSFIPFDFDPAVFQASTGFGLSQVRLQATNLDDLITNLLIYIPIGVACVVCGPPSADRGRLVRVPLAIVVGVAVSLVAETLQTSLAMRVASWTDVLLNGMGTAIGAVGCVLLYDMASTAFERLQRQGRERPFTTCTLVLTIGLLTYNLVPFDFVTSTSGLQASFLRARWDLITPRVAATGALPFAPMIAELYGAFWFMLLGYTAALAAREAGLGPSRALGRAIRDSAPLVVLIEFMQLFTMSQGFDLASIVIRLIGVMIGARTAIYLIDATTGSRWRYQPGLAVPTLLLLLLGALQVVALLVSAADEAIMLRTGLDLSRVRWIPFEALWHEPFARAACIAISSLATYGTLAVTLAILLRRARISYAGWMTGVGVVLLAIIVESIQAASITRTADLTMPILAAIATAIATRAYMRLRRVPLAGADARPSSLRPTAMMP